MRSRPDRNAGFSGTRTLALATALVVHGGALLLLLVPDRPAVQARDFDPATTDVLFLVPPPKPPPPPIAPVEPITLPLRPVSRRQATPRPAPTPVTIPAPADPGVLTEESEYDPPTPPGPDQPAVSAAHVDASYGKSNRLRYPIQALRQREQGRVQLRVLIGGDGAVQRAQVVRSSGSARLDQAALQSVRQWRFVAAQRDGQGIASWVIVPIEFSLASG